MFLRRFTFSISHTHSQLDRTSLASEHTHTNPSPRYFSPLRSSSPTIYTHHSPSPTSPPPSRSKAQPSQHTRLGSPWATSVLYPRTQFLEPVPLPHHRFPPARFQSSQVLSCGSQEPTSGMCRQRCKELVVECSEAKPRWPLLPHGRGARWDGFR